MKDPSDSIRTWLYGVLYGTISYGGVTVPVYSFPPKDAAMPYIVIGEQSMDAEDMPKDSWITSSNVTLEIYNSYTGNDATYKAVNAISEDVLEIVRQRTPETHGSGGATVGLITGYSIISITFRGSLTDRVLFEDRIIIFKQIDINLLLEES